MAVICPKDFCAMQQYGEAKGISQDDVYETVTQLRCPVCDRLVVETYIVKVVRGGKDDR